MDDQVLLLLCLVAHGGFAEAVGCPGEMVFLLAGDVEVAGLRGEEVTGLCG